MRKRQEEVRITETRRAERATSLERMVRDKVVLDSQLLKVEQELEGFKNLKAELEIRHLHEKMDHLLRRQYNRLFEIQQIQIELLEEISQRKRSSARAQSIPPANSPA